MSERESRTERSYCRICTSLCGILVDIEGEKVVAVRGDRDHPVTRGYLCPKGRALPRMHHDPRRLEHPHGHEHANVNLLTSIREVDSLTGMARYSGIPVSVHPGRVASI
jgi:predicted molibdopterin-dependent oxidoreductase YjgC